MRPTCFLSASRLALVLLCCFSSVRLSSAGSLESSLKPLYQVTEAFLDAIQPPDKSVLLRDMVPTLISGNTSQLFVGDWSSITRQWISSYLGYTILICIGAFLIIFVPLIGFCVCCCRVCCNKCGGNRLNYMERKGSACRRGFYGILLLIFATAMLFGCVFALLANQQFRNQLTDGKVFNDFAKTTNDIADLMTSLPDRGRNATSGAVADVAGRIRPRVNATLGLLQWRLSSEANGTGLNGLGTLDSVRQVIDKFLLVSNLTGQYVTSVGSYASNVSALNTTLIDIKNNLTEPPFKCPSGANPNDCTLVNETIGRLANFSWNADAIGKQRLEELRNNLVGVNVSVVLIRMREAESALANVSTVGMEMFDKYLADALRNLNGSQLMSQWDSINSSLLPLVDSIRRVGNYSDLLVPNPLTRERQNLSQFVAYVDSFRFYLFVGLAAYGLLLAALLYFGLLWGCAGEPPYEDASCCNRGVGANFMLSVVGLGCLLYSLLLLLTMIFFLSGGVPDTELCRYLTGRTGQYGYSLLDNAARNALDRYSNGLSLGNNVSLRDVVQKPASSLLNSCQGQASLAAAFNLSALVTAVGLPKLIDQFVNRTAWDLANRGSEFLSGVSFNFSQLDELGSLAANTSKLNFSQFEAELQKPLLDESLAVFLTALGNISRDCNASDPVESSRFEQLQASLSSAASAAHSSRIELLNRLSPLRPAFVELNISAAALTDRLASLDKELRSPNRLWLLIHQSAVEGGVGSAEQLIDPIVLPALDGLFAATLDCASVGLTLNRAVSLPCVQLLRPYNGFWAGYGLCLICLLPCLILAIKLANLYRKTQKYLADLGDDIPKPV